MRIRKASDLGAMVRDRRGAVGMTQTALADRAGVSRRWLAALEAGKTTAEIGLVLRTLDALGLAVTVDPAGETPGGVDLDQILAAYDREAP